MSMQQLMQMMQNPQIKALMNTKSPQQAIQMMMQQNPQLKNNEMFQNFVRMANSGDMKGIEQMGRNLCQSQGQNPDEVINIVKNMTGIR